MPAGQRAASPASRRPPLPSAGSCLQSSSGVDHHRVSVLVPKTDGIWGTQGPPSRGMCATPFPVAYQGRSRQTTRHQACGQACTCLPQLLDNILGGWCMMRQSAARDKPAHCPCPDPMHSPHLYRSSQLAVCALCWAAAAGMNSLPKAAASVPHTVPVNQPGWRQTTKQPNLN